MKYFLASIFALLPGLAMAHPGHTEVVDGHSHSLMDLAVYSAIPALILLAFAVGFFLLRRGNK
ncbi:DUF6732 family protein [Maritalea sp. S77]|uniref:DUF6732 family protein n=1 Tax=Maritalea sp. S77 TaxID=3415125 RepID=UPI003C7D7924